MQTRNMKLIPRAGTLLLLLLGVFALAPSLARAQAATETPCPGGKLTCPQHDQPPQTRAAVAVNAAPGDKNSSDKKPAVAERRSGAIVASDEPHRQHTERPFTEATIAAQPSGSAPKTSTAPAGANKPAPRPRATVAHKKLVPPPQGSVESPRDPASR